MAGKVVLHYLNGRGRMESIRWLLAVAGVEFEEVFLTTRDQYLKMVMDGALLFHQVPMVEMDGMKLVQTRAIMNYIAGKYNLYGKDLKERLMIDMYAEGARDIIEMIMMLDLLPPEKMQKELHNIECKSKERTLPAFEKALTDSQFIVGNQLSCADVHLFETILMLEELFPNMLATFPNIQAFKKRVEAIPNVQRFLEPGSQRKPPHDEVFTKVALEVFSHIYE